jgi:hypothetical protein
MPRMRFVATPATTATHGPAMIASNIVPMTSRNSGRRNTRVNVPPMTFRPMATGINTNARVVNSAPMFFQNE